MTGPHRGERIVVLRVTGNGTGGIVRAVGGGSKRSHDNRTRAVRAGRVCKNARLVGMR